jgi:hypothetical protein
MLFLHDAARWALPIFWLGIATAAFFTAQVLRVEDALFLLPLGTAALVLALLTAGLSVLWRR